MKYFWLLGAVMFFVSSCSLLTPQPEIEFRVARAPEFELSEIDALVVGEFRVQNQEIVFPTAAKEKPQLSPELSSFAPNAEKASAASDLLRAQLLREFSRNAPFRMLNTTAAAQVINGVQPDTTRVAVLRAEVRYSEFRFAQREEVPYFVTVSNEALPLEQQLLGKGLSMGTEELGGGLPEQTPYVELIGAIEARISLTRQSDGSELLPPQTMQAFYVRKWGGLSDTSHVAANVREWINERFQQDEGTLERLLSEKDRTALLANNYNEYLAQGLNLKRDTNVPLTSVALQSRLTQKVATDFVRKVVPTVRKADLRIEDGDPVGVTLLQANAYEEAIAYLQGKNNRSAADDYNLGLAYEASGQRLQARSFFESAGRRDKSNKLYRNALRRVQ